MSKEIDVKCCFCTLDIDVKPPLFCHVVVDYEVDNENLGPMCVDCYEVMIGIKRG